MGVKNTKQKSSSSSPINTAVEGALKSAAVKAEEDTTVIPPLETVSTTSDEESEDDEFDLSPEMLGELSEEDRQLLQEIEEEDQIGDRKKNDVKAMMDLLDPENRLSGEKETGKALMRVIRNKKPEVLLTSLLLMAFMD